MGPRVKGGICPPAGLEGGYRQCFRRLEPNLTLFRRLCQTYEILCVDVVGGRSVHEIDDDLKAGQTEYELEYKYYRPIKGNKSKARDAAFVLLYIILMKELEDTAQLSNQFFGLVLFVLSHRGTFKLKSGACCGRLTKNDSPCLPNSKRGWMNGEAKTTRLRKGRT